MLWRSLQDQSNKHEQLSVIGCFNNCGRVALSQPGNGHFVIF